jgi:hypothetical protein
MLRYNRKWDFSVSIIIPLNDLPLKDFSQHIHEGKLYVYENTKRVYFSNGYWVSKFSVLHVIIRSSLKNNDSSNDTIYGVILLSFT